MKRVISLFAILLLSMGQGQATNLSEWLKDEDNKGVAVICTGLIIGSAAGIAAALIRDLIYQKGRSMYGGDAKSQHLKTREKHINRIGWQAEGRAWACMGIGLAVFFAVSATTYKVCDLYCDRYSEAS